MIKSTRENPFSTWLERHKLKATEAAEILGVHRHSVRAWRKMPARDVPKVVLWACSAYDGGLKPLE